jgi:hypothetical protein
VQRLQSACGDKDRDAITATAHALTHTIRYAHLWEIRWRETIQAFYLFQPFAFRCFCAESLYACVLCIGVVVSS